jgi:hypothetical protein
MCPMCTCWCAGTGEPDRVEDIHNAAWQARFLREARGPVANGDPHE